METYLVPQEKAGFKKCSISGSIYGVSDRAAAFLATHNQKKLYTA